MDSCFAFPRRNGYRELKSDFPDDPTVTVVVGKERRVFAVDSLALEEEPLRVLVGMMGRKRRGYDGRDVVFLDDVECLLFEHLLWLVHNNDCPPVVRFHLRDIVEFYAVDC